jgi:hypothetical protein
MQRPTESNIAPILFWSALQIVTLLLAASRVQLWARMSQPTENYAMQIILVEQIAFAAMLFPWLMRTLHSTAFVFLISALFLQLAGMLGNNFASEIAWAISQIWIWLFALAMWGLGLRSQRTQLLGVAIASGLTIGGACTFYLQSEFSVGRFSFNEIYLLEVVVALSGVIVGVIARFRRRVLSTNC